MLLHAPYIFCQLPRCLGSGVVVCAINNFIIIIIIIIIIDNFSEYKTLERLLL
jgi:hypothetical protein